MERYGNNVLSWASDIDEATLEQAARTAAMPFVHSHLALMSDAHLGMGATVGSVIATAGAVIPAAVGVDLGCVDGATEYLSPSGWLRIDAYDGGQVMQYHPETGRSDFVQPVRYIRRRQDTFLHFKTKYGVDQMLTADHRVLCWKVVGRGRRHVQQVVTAAEFAVEHDRLKLGYNAVIETTFEPILSTSLPLDDDQLRVQVMVMADATLERGTMAVVRVKKARKIERARKLLDAADIAYTEQDLGDGVAGFRFLPPIPTKTYANMWTASLHQLQVITEECWEWDGHAADRVFFTRSKPCADFIHYAFAASGYRSVMRSDVHRRDGGTDYRVFANTNTRVGLRGSPKAQIKTSIAADGMAYCFSVPSGFLVLRRGGNIFTTGNCGVVAAETPFTSTDLPDNLGPLHGRLRNAIPAGVGQAHDSANAAFAALAADPRVDLTDKQERTAGTQLGTLGSGNHFVEVCLDERDHVWIMLHSGSRGIGNQLASRHIEAAKGLMARYFVQLDDPDLAYLVEGTAEFDAYINAMLWAQDYARENRAVMMRATLAEFAEWVGHPFEPVSTVDCHHNFCEKEHHGGRDVWVTRKGAVRARVGDRGVIPGSMGTRSYVVSGAGNAASFHSCSHGAGRRMSRKQARRQLDLEGLVEAMVGKAWNDSDAGKLIDEDPRAYKDIDQVMADQADLVTVDHTLTQILNLKGL